MNPSKSLVVVAAAALCAASAFALTPTDLATLGTKSYNTSWGQSQKLRVYKDLAYSTREDLSTEGAGYSDGGNNGKHRSGTYFDVYVRDSYFTSVDQRTKMPVFVFLHGGAWCQDYDKDVACEWLLRCIAEKGYFVVTMDYQLQEDVITHSDRTERANATFGHMLKDVDTMLAYLKTELPKINVLTNNIVIGGESAGGHLAMCYAFDETNPLPMSSVGLQPLTHPLHISCVLSDVGPTDLSGGTMSEMMFSPYFDYLAMMYPQAAGFKKLFGWLTGTDWTSSSMTYEQAMKLVQDWAPNFYVNQNTCPGIFAYGCTTNANGEAQSDDSLVPVSNFVDITNRFKKAGIYHKAKLFVGTDHGSVAGVGATWMADRLYEFKTNFFNVTIPAVDAGPSVSYGTLDASAFSKKVDVTFGGYSGTSTLTNFPVLVKLSTSISGFSYNDFNQKSTGGDLRFMASNGKLIPHEIDTWNPNGVSTVWVKVPYLTGTTTKITACYGCANPPAVNPKDVWDSNYVGVWHLGESSIPLKESSKRSRDFSAAIGTGFGYAATGIVGGSVNFGATGKGRMLDAADNYYLDGFTNCTFEAWTYVTGRPTSGDKNVAWLTKRNATNIEYSYLFFDDGSGSKFRVGIGTNMVDSGVSVASVPSNSWTHQVFTFNSGATESYKNGANKKTGTSTATKIFAGASDLHLGNFQMGDARNFPGRIDEVRISRKVRSADWVKATYETVTKSNFAAYALQTNAVPPQPTVVYAKSVNVAFGGVQSGVTLTNFPVLVRLSAKIPGFKYSDFKQLNGGDLRFFDASGNLLSHEIDTWNASGVSTVWVKVPRLNSSTTITAKYSCTSGTPPTVNAKDVWDDDFVGVWHLGESALPMKESSETTSDFTSKYGTTIGFAADGVVGGAVDFPADGLTNALVAADHDKLDGFTKFTIETWTFQLDHKNNAGILSKRKEYNKECAYYIYDAIGDSKCIPFCIGTNRNTGARWSFNQTQTMGEWNHIVYSADMASTTKNVHGYKNGTMNGWEPNAVFFGAMPNCDCKLILGNLGENKKDYSFNGKIDEVRISKCVRSKAWVRATYDTIMKSDFATYSTSSGTLSGYAAWANAKELSGAFDATEAKGIPNGIRYAFDIDPAKGPESIGTPIIQVVRDANGNPVVEARDLASGRSDITFGILATENLNDWNSAHLIQMEKFATDGLWKPSDSASAGYVFPDKLFFKYKVDVK